MGYLLPLAVLALVTLLSTLPTTAEKPESKPVTYCSAGLAYRRHLVLANLSADSPVPGGRPVVCSTLTKPFIHCGANASASAGPGAVAGAGAGAAAAAAGRSYRVVTMADGGGQHTLYDGTAHSSVNLTYVKGCVRVRAACVRECVWRVCVACVCESVCVWRVCVSV